MTDTTIPNHRATKIDTLIAVHNQVVKAVCQHYHSPFGTDGTANAALITSPDSSDIATSKVLAKELADDLALHAADTSKHSEASTVACAAYTSSPGAPADLTEVQNIANELKTDLTAHIINATPHRFANLSTAHTALLAATAAATNQGTADTLLNVLKKVLNDHDRNGAQGIVLAAG